MTRSTSIDRVQRFMAQARGLAETLSARHQAAHPIFGDEGAGRHVATDVFPIGERR